MYGTFVWQHKDVLGASMSFDGDYKVGVNAGMLFTPKISVRS